MNNKKNNSISNVCGNKTIVIEMIKILTVIIMIMIVIIMINSSYL